MEVREDLREIVQIGRDYLGTIYGPELNDLELRLEEVVPVDGDYNLTFSMDGPRGSETRLYAKRDYKVVRVNQRERRGEWMRIWRADEAA